ncbi:TPA: hypothetical protein ACS8CE_003496 [Providencia alcalifaciens]
MFDLTDFITRNVPVISFSLNVLFLVFMLAVLIFGVIKSHSLFVGDDENSEINIRKNQIGLLRDVKKICSTYQRGIYKRIDENRELLDLLCKENSDFIKSHWYVVNWIKSQDDFLVKMADTLKIEKPLGGNNYPREFKSKEESKK